MPKLLAVVGRKGSGKSQVLEELVEFLSHAGRRVGVIKRLAKDDIEIDQPGKDTFRYRMRGAASVMLAGRRRLALFCDLTAELPLKALLEPFANFDLVFLEDYFFEHLPALEVYRRETGEEPLCLLMKSITVICADQPLPSSVIPYFGFHQLPSLVSWIEKKILKSNITRPKEAAHA